MMEKPLDASSCSHSPKMELYLFWVVLLLKHSMLSLLSCDTVCSLHGQVNGLSPLAIIFQFSNALLLHQHACCLPLGPWHE